MAKAKAKVKAKTYPTKPTEAERETQFDQPPTKMPESLAGIAAPPVAANAADDAPAEEKGWADVKEGASPDRWQIMEGGMKTAGGPIKHSLCPGCIHLNREGMCGGPMDENTRNNPATISCMNARRIDGELVS